MEQPLSPSDVRAQVVATSAVVFLVMLGVGIVAPILPLYARTFAESYTLAGFVISAFGLARLLFDVPSGFLSDKLGRRPTIITGILVFSLGGLLSGLAGDFYTLLGARFLQGIGASIYTTSALAYVADIAPASSRGRYLAYYQGSFSLGVAVGPALGGFLVRPELGGLRGPFFVLSGIALAGAIYAYFSLRPGSKRREPIAGRAGPSSLSSIALRMVGSRDALVINLGAIVVFISTSGIRGTAIPFFGIEHLALNEAQVGIVLGVAAMMNFLFMGRAGSLVDRLGGKRTITYGFLSTGITLILFAYTWSFESIVLVAALFGLATSIAMSSVAVSAVEVSDPQRRGFSLGIYRLFNDIGIISGPIISGLLLEGYGFTSPFIGVALLSLMVSILAATAMSKQQHPALEAAPE
jgi:DHA1 family multidrug resistance protein-like MFS transporter